MATPIDWSDRFFSKVQPEPMSGCWLWTAGLNSSGYGSFAPTPKRTGQSHRLAYEKLVGPIPEGMWVLHKCDNRVCVNPDHLFLGDVQANVDDMLRKKRWKPKKGIEHWKSKFSEDQIVGIRLSEKTVSELAKAFGVSKSTISSIRSGTFWKGVGGISLVSSLREELKAERATNHALVVTVQKQEREIKTLRRALLEAADKLERAGWRQSADLARNAAT